MNMESESTELVYPAHDVGLALTAACSFDPGTALEPQPLEHLQVTSSCCPEGGIRIPAAPHLPQVLKHTQMTAPSGEIADDDMPRAPVV